jgi:methylenetetrahydrofolate dehydrogenase (NADP+)/methenyltetrahydrofolate cyclohydrolase
MAAQIIDGKNLSGQILEKLADEVVALGREFAYTPKLAVILVGDNNASQVYVQNKIRAAANIGIEVELVKLPTEVTSAQLNAHIDRLNQDELVSGIIVQLPLPPAINSDLVKLRIFPEKDVDGFHPYNLGRLLSGDQDGYFVACTALGILKLIQSCSRQFAGNNVVIIGRSAIVGRPTAALLLNNDFTVTMCHSRTSDLKAHTSNADVVISAIGIPHFLTCDYFDAKSMVIDVGINRLLMDGKMQLVGDVDFASVSQHVSFITPVPGGVGPMTVACLMSNTVLAARIFAMRRQNG